MSHEEIYNIYVYKKMYTGQNYIYVVINTIANTELGLINVTKKLKTLVLAYLLVGTYT